MPGRFVVAVTVGEPSREKLSVTPEAGIEHGPSWDGQAPPGPPETVPKRVPLPSEAAEPPPQPTSSTGIRTSKSLTPES